MEAWDGHSAQLSLTVGPVSGLGLELGTLVCSPVGRWKKVLNHTEPTQSGLLLPGTPYSGNITTHENADCGTKASLWSPLGYPWGTARQTVRDLALDQPLDLAAGLGSGPEVATLGVSRQCLFEYAILSSMALNLSCL